jgi:hypothetical protein
VGEDGRGTHPGGGGSHADGAALGLKDTPGEATLTPGSPRGPGFSPPREDASDDKISVPGSFDIVDLGTGELGLPGYPERRFCLPAGGKWWVCGLMYLQIATVHRLLKEMLAMVGRDVLQPARVSPKTDMRGFFT